MDSSKIPIIKEEELVKFILIPEEHLLNWMQSFSQEEIDTNESALFTVRTLQKIHLDGLLTMDDEIILNEENPEKEKFKEWTVHKNL